MRIPLWKCQQSSTTVKSSKAESSHLHCSDLFHLRVGWELLQCSNLTSECVVSVTSSIKQNNPKLQSPEGYCSRM